MTYPLQGIVVIDLTHVLAGPYCSNQLLDLGARVIKIERPGLGDDTRRYPPFVGQDSAYFASLNRGKQSIALNLKADADRAVMDRLLARADVLLENNRPGVMERLGYGWDTLHARHPRLIYGAVSGFGHTGPESGRPAYDMVVQARGGVMSITGEAGRDPVRVGASIGDIVAGMFLTQGVLAALLARTQTGRGQKIDVAMLDSQLAILEHAVALTAVTGVPPGPNGARHPTIAPFETYHAQDGLFVLAAGNDALFARACVALGLGPLDRDPRFATNAARCENVKTLKRLVETATLSRPRAYWMAALEDAGVPTAAIQNVAQVMQDPQIRARNMVVQIDPGPGGRPLPCEGNPVKMSDLPDPSRLPPAPALDGDRQAVLDWLAETEAGSR